jgi:hypothetical protein
MIKAVNRLNLGARALVNLYGGGIASWYSVCVGYRLNDRRCVVRVPAEARGFCLLLSVERGYVAYPAPYSVGTGGSFTRFKEAWM